MYKENSCWGFTGRIMYDSDTDQNFAKKSSPLKTQKD